MMKTATSFSGGRRLEIKLESIPLRFLDWGRDLPRRGGRLLRHLGRAFRRGPVRFGVLIWTTELFCLVIDLLGVSEWYETMADWIKFNSRPLSERERRLAFPVFGDSIRYHRVRIDERAWLGPRQWSICYVSFFHINSWRAMPDDILIHELVHVWQYQHMGSRYIPRALRAQRTPPGYNYGGGGQLRRFLREGKGLRDFNLEQQADLVADYFRIARGRPPRWGGAGRDDLWLYEHFVGQIRPAPDTGGPLM